MILSINNKALQSPLWTDCNFLPKGINLHAQVPCLFLFSSLTIGPAAFHGHKFLTERISYCGSCNGIQKGTHLEFGWVFFDNLEVFPDRNFLWARKKRNKKQQPGSFVWGFQTTEVTTILAQFCNLVAAKPSKSFGMLLDFGPRSPECSHQTTLPTVRKIC